MTALFHCPSAAARSRRPPAGRVVAGAADAPPRAEAPGRYPAVCVTRSPGSPVAELRVRPPRTRPRARRRSANWSIEACAGASSTVSPGRREPAGLVDGAGHHRSSVAGIDHDHGNLGRVSGRAPRPAARRSTPMSDDGAQPVAPGRDELVERAPPWPDRRRPTPRCPGGNAARDAAAACALVALESSTYATPSTTATLCDAVRARAVGPQPVADRGRLDAVRERERGGGERVRDDVRRDTAPCAGRSPRHCRGARGRRACPARPRACAAGSRTRGRRARPRRDRPARPAACRA